MFISWDKLLGLHNIKSIGAGCAGIDDICASLFAQPDEKAAPPEEPMSANRIRWEHIQRVYELCDKNVSETARRLKMHRRTLQRILSKRAPS